MRDDQLFAVSASLSATASMVAGAAATHRLVLGVTRGRHTNALHPVTILKGDGLAAPPLFEVAAPCKCQCFS